MIKQLKCTKCGELHNVLFVDEGMSFIGCRETGYLIGIEEINLVEEVDTNGQP